MIISLFVILLLILFFFILSNNSGTTPPISKTKPLTINTYNCNKKAKEIALKIDYYIPESYFNKNKKIVVLPFKPDEDALVSKDTVLKYLCEKFPEKISKNLFIISKNKYDVENYNKIKQWTHTKNNKYLKQDLIKELNRLGITFYVSGHIDKAGNIYKLKYSLNNNKKHTLFFRDAIIFNKQTPNKTKKKKENNNTLLLIFFMTTIILVLIIVSLIRKLNLKKSRKKRK